MDAREREARDRWNRRVPLGMEGHHCVRRQYIERLCKSAGLPVVDWAWDLRWLILLGPQEHARHTTRFRRLPISVVPERAWQAARELDAMLTERGVPATAVIELRREYAA